MFKTAQQFLKIDMQNSVMVGDKISDLQAADNAGVKTKILVKTGKPVTEEGENFATAVLDSICDLPGFLE
jgi:D-glycero-D-manno-heptose 1,7-bisphosphate phosphatase